MITRRYPVPLTRSSDKPGRQKLAGQVSGSEIPDAVRLNTAVVDTVLDGAVSLDASTFPSAPRIPRVNEYARWIVTSLRMIYSPSRTQ